MKMKWLIAATVLTLAGLFAIHSARRSHISNRLTQPMQEQRLAPDFALPQLDGSELRLSAYRGKVVLLDFWATWCAPCREETPAFIELQRKYSSRGLQIIGVSMDDGPAPVRAFYQEFHITYPIVLGNAKTGELYGGVLGLPIAFLIARDGHIYAKHMGATNSSVIEKEIQTLLQ